jgi:3-hydroxybutyryl-CoA dehydrogenase
MPIYRLSDSKPSTIIIPDQSERVAFGVAAVLAQKQAPFWIYAERSAGILTPFAEHFAPAPDALPAMPQVIVDCSWLPNSESVVEDLIELYPTTPLLFASPCLTSTHLQTLYGSAAVVRFNGMPALFPEMQRLEIAASLNTTPEITSYVERYFQLLGFETELVGDVVGLITPRVLAMLVNEAAFAVQEGVASVADTDNAMKLGTNYPKGPLEWADEMGLDLVLALLDSLHNEYKQERYRACSLLRRTVHAGRYGRLVRHGFYEYDTAGARLTA